MSRSARDRSAGQKIIRRRRGFQLLRASDISVVLLSEMPSEQGSERWKMPFRSRHWYEMLMRFLQQHALNQILSDRYILRPKTQTPCV
ncbi:LOW QUALITY PROTEIN: hypothetical protein YC2023_028697 [Brassica napus]